MKLCVEHLVFFPLFWPTLYISVGEPSDDEHCEEKFIVCHYEPVAGRATATIKHTAVTM